MAEVGWALKQALEIKAARTAFMANYKRTPSGLRLRRGLARILVLRDNRNLQTFFDVLSASDDENR